jgi:hypothetical protein
MSSASLAVSRSANIEPRKKSDGAIFDHRAYPAFELWPFFTDAPEQGERDRLNDACLVADDIPITSDMVRQYPSTSQRRVGSPQRVRTLPNLGKELQIDSHRFTALNDTHPLAGKMRQNKSSM